MATTRAELWRVATQRLGSPVEARWVLDEVLDAGHAGPVTAAEAAAVDAIVERCRRGEPLQYVLGHWPFRRIELTVDGRALIPRPETEELVDVALGELERLAPVGGPVIVDLGTGSGCLALALADELSAAHRDLEVWGVDDDPGALALAGANLEALEQADRCWEGRRGVVRFARGSWWGALPTSLARRVHLAVANPPYVAEQEWAALDPSVREHEPRQALVAGDGPHGTPGLRAVAEILEGATGWLARPGALVVELAPAQAEPACRLARAQGGGDACDARVVDDVTGRHRFVVVRVGP